MLLDHLGYRQASAAIVTAIEQCLQNGPRTPDIGGNANTEDVGKAIASAISELGQNENLQHRGNSG